MALVNFPRTPESKKLAVLRITVGSFFILAGLAKLIVPEVANTFQEQLRYTGVPGRDFIPLVLPILEMTAGYFLLIGKFTRFWSFLAILLMVLAVYINLRIEDPALYLLQLSAPLIPSAMLAVCAVLLVIGAGTWSKDLDIFEK